MRAERANTVAGVRPMTVERLNCYLAEYLTPVDPVKVF